MSKFQRSWALFRSAMHVLGQHKKLLWFPITTTLLTLVIIAFFLIPLAFWNTGHAMSDPEHWKALASNWFTWSHVDNYLQMHVNPAGYVLLAGIYLLATFFITFFNVAFFNEIINALNGRPVSILGGFRFAVSRLKAIAAWSLFTGVIGLFIKSLEERLGWVGQWIVKLIGIAWSVASVFAVPVIVREGNHATPMKFLKTSAGILKKTWGESLIGYVGIQVGGWLFAGVALIAAIVVAAIASLFGAVYSIVLGLATFFILVFIAAYVVSVASQVYRGALFIYATEGVVPGPFDAEMMEMAWKVKSGRKSL